MAPSRQAELIATVFFVVAVVMLVINLIKVSTADSADEAQKIRKETFWPNVLLAIVMALSSWWSPVAQLFLMN